MIELLRSRVDELAALDPDCTLLGSSAHRYPPYPEAELAQLERATADHLLPVPRPRVDGRMMSQAMAAFCPRSPRKPAHG